VVAESHSRPSFGETSLGSSETLQKTQADKKRIDRQFEVGDMVFFKLQPYVRLSVIALITSFPSVISSPRECWSVLVV
jgi:hypothetical protein